MKRMRVRVSTGRYCAAMLALLPASFFAGCGGRSGSGPAVLRETEVLRHLPRGTHVELPDTHTVIPPEQRAFEVTAPEGAWLVSAAYLSRIHELLGRDAGSACEGGYRDTHSGTLPSPVLSPARSQLKLKRATFDPALSKWR